MCTALLFCTAVEIRDKTSKPPCLTEYRLPGLGLLDFHVYYLQDQGLAGQEYGFQWALPSDIQGLRFTRRRFVTMSVRSSSFASLRYRRC